MTAPRQVVRAAAIVATFAAGHPPMDGARSPAASATARAPDARILVAQRVRSQEIDTIAPPALSRDGRLIAFVSRLGSIGGESCCQGVYVLDRHTAAVTVETISPTGARPDGDSNKPTLSSDGRTVAFETLASNLVSHSADPVRRRIVVRERGSGVMHTPQGAGGEPPDHDAREPVFARDGTAVAFTSGATNLASTADANGPATDVYLWRLDARGPIIRVSVDAQGVQRAAGASHSASLNADGQTVAFVSTARLAAEDQNDLADVYLRDLRRGLTWLVSRGVGGKPSNGHSYAPAVSADARVVAFVSKADNLGPSDRNMGSDVYVYDATVQSIELVSGTAAGVAANAASTRPAVSADGQHVVFQSVASNLGSRAACPPTAPDRNLLPDVYLLNRTTGCVTRISGSSDREWWTPSVAPAMDDSGSLVVFSSTQPAGEDDASTDLDLFLFEISRPGRDGRDRKHRMRTPP